MQESRRQIAAAVFGWIVLALCAAYSVRAAWGASYDAGTLAVSAALGAAALLAAALAARDATLRPRLGTTFVLAALVLLPGPLALVVGLLALLGGSGAGLAGGSRRSASSASGWLLGLVLAAFLTARLPARYDWSEAWGLVGLVAPYLLLQAGAWLPVAASSGRRRRTPAGRVVLLEGVNVALAWLLAALVLRHGTVEAVALAGLVLAVQGSLIRWGRLRGELDRSRRDLASRMTELQTLHAAGREILASVDPDRVCAVIDRECRKLFEADGCLIALAETPGGELRVRYRRLPSAGAGGKEREGRAVSTSRSALHPWLLRIATEMKRGCRVDDLARIDGAGAAAPAAELRSMLLAPMIVSERVLGLVAVYGRRPGAYDDHGLSVLTTIAHQGAVAIESERHYRSATEDSLTGFYVRDYFFERLREEQGRASRYGGRFSLLMIDLDGFKKINDDHGHLAGDRYLRAVGDAIRSQLRGADIACRYGGDEFCVLLPQTDLAGARVIAERVRVAVGSTVASYGGKPLRTTASIGVAVWPADGGPSERDLVRHADEALYRAKREGRDRVVPFAA